MVATSPDVNADTCVMVMWARKNWRYENEKRRHACDKFFALNKIDSHVIVENKFEQRCSKSFVKYNC